MNGAIVTIARVPSLVVTLGTLYVIRGLDARLAGGHQVGASALPNSFTNIGYGTVLGVPYLGIAAIVAVAIATYAMRSFRTPRDFYAIGSNPDAARLAGIPVERRVFLAFALSGAIAGVAGAFWLSLLRLRRRDRRPGLRVPGDRRRRRRRRRHLRRQRHGARRSARARCS